MTRLFTINGKSYRAQEFTYNTICELQDRGIDMDKMGDRGASMTRAFFSIWSGLTLEQAGNELGQHMINGGSFDELGKVIEEAMENSDFFRALTKTAKADPEESKQKKPENE